MTINIQKNVIRMKKHMNLGYNNNHQAFYSQASWGRLEIKPHKLKKQGQNKSKKGKKKAIKNQIKKGEMAIKRMNLGYKEKKFREIQRNVDMEMQKRPMNVTYALMIFKVFMLDFYKNIPFQS
jgi:hypothetical protein